YIYCRPQTTLQGIPAHVYKFLVRWVGNRSVQCQMTIGSTSSSVMTSGVRGQKEAAPSQETRRCRPHEGVAQLGGIQLARYNLSRAERVDQLRFFNDGLSVMRSLMRRQRHTGRMPDEDRRFYHSPERPQPSSEFEQAKVTRGIGPGPRR